jgi:hypothetical protein
LRLNVRRNLLITDELREVAGQKATPSLLKISVVAVVENPCVDRYVEDLSPFVRSSIELGQEMAKRAAAALNGQTVESYGKAGLVGLRGEQEHANALLTTAFATPFRAVIGQAPAWISSVTKVTSPGATVDVPVNNVHDIYVRSHYDTVSLAMPGVPMPDEVAVIFCMVTRGRVGARVGGLTHAEALGKAAPA